VLSAGFNIHPADKVEIGLSLNYVEGEASMGSFDLSSDFAARAPNSSYDFSRTPDWSNLDLDGLDAWIELKYRFTKNLFARGAYRYVKYDDNDPYLYDLTGRNSLVYFSLGYLF
jgi:hypothetical protein